MAGGFYFDCSSTHYLVGYQPYNREENMVLVNGVRPGMSYDLRGGIPCNCWVILQSRLPQQSFEK